MQLESMQLQKEKQSMQLQKVKVTRSYHGDSLALPECSVSTSAWYLNTRSCLSAGWSYQCGHASCTAHVALLLPQRLPAWLIRVRAREE